MDLRTLHFTIVDEGGPRVRLSVDGAAPVEAAFAFDLRKGERTFEVLQLVDSGACDMENLQDVGSKLWSALLPGDVGRRFDAIRAEAARARARLCFRLELPPALAGLPWEALHDMREVGFVATAPDFTIVRHPPEMIAPPDPGPRPAGPLKVLVVIPEGSFLRVDAEYKNIERAFLPYGTVKRLDGRVTPIRLARELQQGGHDVVHFIGHGQSDASGAVSVRLNDEVDHAGEIWVGTDPFAGFFRQTSVRLAVLNCCLGADASKKRTLSGLGPYLLRAGVPAVVAMRYEIPDGVAVQFSSAFYGELLTGAAPGHVDAAAQAARSYIAMNARIDTVRGFITPVLFLAAGQERVFEVRAATPGAAPAPSPRSAPRVQIPPRLAEALAAGQCVPVIGPGVLAAEVRRSGGSAATPSPGALARRLADASGYPEMLELGLGESAGDWLDPLILQRVCQHYEQQHERPGLTRAVLEAHPAAEPSPLLETIARWRMPGVIYAHFDGLMDVAFQSARRPVRVADAVGTGLAALDASAPLLVHLRGSVRDSASLVLTEVDHDALWDSFARIDQAVVSLVSGDIGRSLLFLGVSPRDVFVKRFINKLLNPTILKNFGWLYFARSGASAVDEACWSRYSKIKWIDADLAALIEELTLAGGEERGP